MQLNNTNTTQLKKRAKDLNRQLPKEDIQMANKLMKRCLTSLVIRETQIKTTRYHFTHTGMARIIKKSNNNKCVGEDMGEIRTLIHPWWTCKMV